MERFFDRVADSYDQDLDFFGSFGRELVRFAGVGPGTRLVLDLACGRGAVGAAARTATGGVARVIGVDTSPGMLRAGANQSQTPVALIQARAAHLPLRDSMIDMVLCGFALHIMPDADLALAEIRRVLRPGGTLAFSVPGPAAGDERWRFYGALLERFAPQADPARQWRGTPAPLDELVTTAGFTDLRPGRAEVHLPLRDAEQFWTWHQSHGYRAFVDALPEAARHEFKAEVIGHVAALLAAGPLTLDRGATLTRCRS